MFTDIVFPDNNEEKFIERAKLLGYDSLCFVYNTIQKPKNNQTELKIFSALLSDKPKNKKQFDLTIINAKSPEINRKNFEQGKFDIIFNLENNERQDFIHQRNSGLNQILCRLAKTKYTCIGISFSNILERKPFDRAKLIGRIEQNLELCIKYKLNVVFASFASRPEQMRSPQDLRAFINCICNNEKLSKEALTNLFLILEENIKKKDKNYISKDFKVIEE